MASGAEEAWAAVALDDFRQVYENDKHWAARREFLARHIHEYPGPKVDQLLALSVVWSNIVFIGNRYGEQLTQKVHQMAEGIDIGEMPSYELVPGAKATKRPATSETTEQPQKKKFGPRPRFEPVHFVVSTLEDDKQFQRIKKSNNTSSQEKSEPHDSSLHHPETEKCSEMDSSFSPYVYDPDVVSDQTKTEQPQKKKFGPRPRFEPVHFVVSTVEDDKQFQRIEKSNDTNKPPDSSIHPPETEKCFEMESNFRPYVYDPDVVPDQIRSEYSNFMTKMEQDYSAKFESHYSSLSKDFRSNVLDTWTDKNSNGRKGIGFVKPPKKCGRRESVSISWDKPTFIKRLSVSVRKKMKDPLIAPGTTWINYTHMLSQSVQACKANPEYIYVPLREIPPSNFPRLMKIPSDGFACEVRCQDIYLATGYSRSRNGARDKAAEQAVQLLMKPGVKVLCVKRRFGHEYLDDMVACCGDVPQTEFPPALKQGEHVNGGLQEGTQSCETLKGSSTKPWTDLILTENACNAVGILGNSAIFNKMTLDYKFDMVPPNNLWRCSVYVQDHCVAEAYGNKKTSKHAAAEKAINIFKNLHPNQQKPNPARSAANAAVTSMKDIVIYDNNAGAVCTLNATAQFNKVPIEYMLEQTSGLHWRCQVLIGQQIVAEATGNKKTVKHEAAEAALMVLKKTQPVIVNTPKKSPAEDAISRNQIRGLSNDEAYKQEIKEDNIGNQLLRKMGWTGGGLGKGGDGIAEPISVKEKFSREGLGSTTISQKITKREVAKMIRDYAVSSSQENLTFSSELSNEERKHIHEVAQRHGLKSKSYGQGTQRFLVVSRKMNKNYLIHQLRQGAQVGSYTIVLPNQ